MYGNKIGLSFFSLIIAQLIDTVNFLDVNKPKFNSDPLKSDRKPFVPIYKQFRQNPLKIIFSSSTLKQIAIAILAILSLVVAAKLIDRIYNHLTRKGWGSELVNTINLEAQSQKLAAEYFQQIGGDGIMTFLLNKNEKDQPTKPTSLGEELVHQILPHLTFLRPKMKRDGTGSEINGPVHQILSREYEEQEEEQNPKTDSETDPVPGTLKRIPLYH